MKADNADEKANEMCEKINSFTTKYATLTSYIEVEVSAFSDEKLKALQKDYKFKNYKRYFEAILRDKKHILSKQEEVLLSKLSEFMNGFSDNFDKFSDVDLKFGEIEDSHGKNIN